MSSAALVLLVVLIVVPAAWSLSANQVPAGALHLTQADWQSADAPGFSITPPPTLDSLALPARWQAVALPLAPPVALLRQAAVTPYSPATRTTWVRLPTRNLPASAGPLALYGSRVKTDGTVAVYANGQLVHQAQSQGPLWNSTRTPLWVLLGQQPAAPPVTEILIRLEHSQRSQVALGSLWLGPHEALQGRYHMRQWLQQELPAMLSAAFMAVGVFALLVWFKRRHETGYLLFFVLAAASFLRGLHFYVSVPIANDWFAWLTVNALFWLVTVAHLFLRQLHGRPLVGFTRGLVGLSVAVGLFTLPPLAIWPNTPKVTPLIYMIVAAMGAAVSIVGGVCAWRRSRDGRLVALGLGICTLLGLSDWLLQNNYVSPEGWYLGAYANAVTFGIFGTLMYRRYVNAIEEAEQFNASLALCLKKREAELEASHRRLREVELRQTLTDERQRLMRDMHDGLGSSLISAIRSAERGGLNQAQVAQLLKDCLDDLKLTIDSMEPVQADLLLLLATLRFRLEPRLEGADVALRWEVQELPALTWLDPTTALHVLRIVQESIANILRHTRATEIRVATTPAPAGVQICIEDNGQGFDVAQALAHSAGRGLHNQRRRAQAVDGRVHWQSSIAGTRFVLWLPLQRGQPSAAASQCLPAWA